MPPHRPQQGEEAVCFLPPGSASLGNAHRSPPGVLREALGRHKLTAQCGLLSRRMGFLCFGPRLRLDAARHSGSAGSVGSHRPPWVEVLGSWLCTAQMPKPWACEVRERPSCHAQSAGPEPLVYTVPWPPRSEILSTGEAQALVGKGDLGGGGTLTFPPPPPGSWDTGRGLLQTEHKSRAQVCHPALLTVPCVVSMAPQNLAGQSGKRAGRARDGHCGWGGLYR